MCFYVNAAFVSERSPETRFLVGYWEHVEGREVFFDREGVQSMVEGNGSTSERGNMQVGEESNTYDKTQEVFSSAQTCSDI